MQPCPFTCIQWLAIWCDASSRLDGYGLNPGSIGSQLGWNASVKKGKQIPKHDLQRWFEIVGRCFFGVKFCEAVWESPNLSFPVISPPTLMKSWGAVHCSGGSLCWEPQTCRSMASWNTPQVRASWNSWSSRMLIVKTYVCSLFDSDRGVLIVVSPVTIVGQGICTK